MGLYHPLIVDSSVSSITTYKASSMNLHNLLGLSVVLALTMTQVVGENIGFCGDCFCIPSPNETCPYELEPDMNFTSFLPNLLEMEWTNPIKLNCDASSNDNECELEPAPGSGGACVVDFVVADDDDGSACPANWTYSTRTFPGTWEEAQSQGLYVTHAGQCGACSSLQDLYVYMAEGDNVRDQATLCGIQGLVSEEGGISCFQEFGFTEGCAMAWHYNTRITREFCIDDCTDLFINDIPTNGPPPQCALHQCIACDETYAGPSFKKHAGRTRRNSGLISGIARTCSELIPLSQMDPCAPITPPPQMGPSAAPTVMPTESGVSSNCSVMLWRGCFVLIGLTTILW